MYANIDDQQVPYSFSKEGNFTEMDSPPTELLIPQNASSRSSLRSFNWANEFNGFKELIFTKINIMLVLVPLGFVSYYLEWDPIAIFVINFFALIPLASTLSNSTEELALHTGAIIGGLLNSTFGNVVEMIISYQALSKGLIQVVEGTLLGSLLSNLLLVLGMAFFFGGSKHYVQKFNAKGATTGTSLLLLASFIIIIPTIASLDQNSSFSLLKITRLSSIFMTLTYFCYLFFQLYTHFSMFTEVEDEHNHSSPGCSFIPSLTMLVISTIFVSFLSEYLTDSIEPIISHYKISENFIGIILLPIVGNAAEHLSAVTFAIKNKVDMTISIAVGSSVQIALLVVPFTVIVGWIIDQPMDLSFSPISGTILMLTIFVVTGIVSDGESNWLEGLSLIIAYSIVAIVFYYV